MIYKELGAVILVLGLLLSTGIIAGQDADPLKQEVAALEQGALDDIAFRPRIQAERLYGG